MSKPLIVVEVRGGLVANVLSQFEADYIVVDYDNLKAGDAPVIAGSAQPAEEITATIDDLLRDLQAI